MYGESCYFKSFALIFFNLFHFLLFFGEEMGRERPISINLEWLDIKFNPKEKENEKPKTKLQ